MDRYALECKELRDNRVFCIEGGLSHHILNQRLIFTQDHQDMLDAAPDCPPNQTYLYT